MSEHDMMVESYVRVTINDRDVVDRCVNNHDDSGIPQPDEAHGTGWRNTHYDLQSEKAVVSHLAYNCVVNGYERVNRLDGWADMDDDAATMTVVNVEIER